MSLNQTEAFETLFNYYARLFTIDVNFMTHGLALLYRKINLEASVHGRLVFRQDPHAVDMNRCRNIVYIKIWNDEQSIFDLPRELQVAGGSRFYVGQTENPRARESSLQPYLRELGDPKVHICLGHDLGTYHKDALETATIAWCMFLQGLALLNRSPFANHYYRNVQADVPVDMVTADHYTSVGAVHHWRLAIIIGTAPPRTVFESFNYQDQHLTEREPFMNWNDFLAWGGLARFRVLIDQANPPPFINHWPGEPCQKIDDWLRGKDLPEIEEVDLALKRRMVGARRYLGVMLGARPTRLTHGDQVEKYLTKTCGSLTLDSLQGANKVVFLWLPDPAVCRYIQLKHQYVLEQLFVCASQAISVIELKLFSLGVSTSSEGIHKNQAEEILVWWSTHPYRKVLRNLSDNLSTIMASYHIDKVIPPVFTAVFDQTSVENEAARLLSLLPPAPTKLNELWYSMTITNFRNNTEVGNEVFISQLQAQDEGSEAIIEGTILFTTNKRFDSFIRKQASRANVQYAVSTVEEQKEILKKAVKEYGLEMRRRFTRKQIRLGHFTPRDDETELMAMNRCRSNFFARRSRIITTEGQVLCTCLTCNFHLSRRDMSGGKLTIKNEHTCTCGRSSFTLGWHILPIVAAPGTYPANNIFVKHIQTLQTPLVINHKQLQASLLDFFDRCHPEEPQMLILKERYEQLFPNMRLFRPQESGNTNDLSHFSLSFNDTYRKLEQLDFNLDVGVNLNFQIISRPPLAIERRAYAESVTRTMHVFAFGYPPEFGAEKDVLLSLENQDYMGYRQALSQVGDERLAARRIRDRQARESRGRGSRGSSGRGNRGRGSRGRGNRGSGSRT